MKNINFNRIGLMMRKYLIESPTIYYGLFPIIAIYLITIIFYRPHTNNTFLFLQSIRVVFLVMALFGITEIFMQIHKLKPNRVNFLQIPASNFEKITALFILQLFSTIILGTLVLFSHIAGINTLLSSLKAISILLYLSLFLMWSNSILTLFRLNFIKTNLYSILMYIVPISIIIYYIGHTNRFMKFSDNMDIYFIIFEAVTTIGCWYLIYRRLANTQIN